MVAFGTTLGLVVPKPDDTIGGFAGADPGSGFRGVPCWHIGPWPDHCGSKRKEKRAFRVSFLAEGVFPGFIGAAPVGIRSGPLQPRPEWGGML